MTFLTLISYLLLFLTLFADPGISKLDADDYRNLSERKYETTGEIKSNEDIDQSHQIYKRSYYVEDTLSSEAQNIEELENSGPSQHKNIIKRSKDYSPPDPFEEEENEKAHRARREATQVRYSNHRYDEESAQDRQTVSRSARSPKRHHYEVHEETGDVPIPVGPFSAAREQDELLGAGAEHYHEVAPAPSAPAAARYSDQAAEGAHPHAHHHHSGGGIKSNGDHYDENESKTKKGYISKGHSEKGASGKEGKEKHTKQFAEAGGAKKKHHDEAGHSGHHDESAYGHKGGEFGEKKGHKKGHKTKGYHNKYHKDEYHKEHKFYDDYNKSGSHHRFGDFNAKHHKEEKGHKKAHHLDSARESDQKGKKGYHQKGYIDADHKSHKNKQGLEKHHAQQSSYGKKGGHAGGSNYGYAKKH